MEYLIDLIIILYFRSFFSGFRLKIEQFHYCDDIGSETALMLKYQLPIVNLYTHTTHDVSQFNSRDYERIETYLDYMKKCMHARAQPRFSDISR